MSFVGNNEGTFIKPFTENDNWKISDQSLSNHHQRMTTQTLYIFVFQHIGFVMIFSIYSKTCRWGHLYWAATCIKRSPPPPVIENFIWIEPLLRGHLSQKATVSLSQRWPLNTGLTVLYSHYWFLRKRHFHTTARYTLKSQGSDYKR